MKKVHKLWFELLNILLIVLFWELALAQAPQFRGFLQLDKRFNVGGDSLTTVDFYNRFRLELSSTLSNKLYSFASLDFRFYDFPRVNSLQNMEDLDQEFPTDLTLWEAYVDLYSFLVNNLDVRVGKQRIAWGTADGLNHTDNLNPDDFSDLVNFTEKIPTWAVKGSYYLGNFTLTGVWLPELAPMLLPRNGASLFMGSGLSEYENNDVRFVSLRDTLILPSQKPQNSMFGLKLAGMVSGWDYSFSYFNGYDDIPILRQFGLAEVDKSGPIQRFTARMEMTFPKMQVLGFDFATELFGIGLWGEGAVFFPKKALMLTVVETSEGNQTYSSVALDDKPYLKYTLGFDYTFPGGWYLNSQWMHGFFTERGVDNLHDYFLSRLEKKFLRDEIKLVLGGVAIEVAEFSDLKNNYASAFFPELSYLPVDNLEISLGVFLVDGKPGTLFGSWSEADQAYFRMKVSF
ncbi:MAG: hypothetical protein GTN68_02370 [Candidatus Aminicenantes bacterium]|nr:hypothetical protein [Candidatus Aminicenantes bacterium]